jgi:ribosomal protein S7
MIKITTKAKKDLVNLNENPFYKSYWINKFINKFMKHGRKNLVEKQVYDAFIRIKRQINENPAALVLKSIDMQRPMIGLTKHIKRVGKKRRRQRIILIPTPLDTRRQLRMSLRWLVELILHQKKRRKKHNHQKLPRLGKQGRKHNYGSSRKKVFNDRFYVALKEQDLSTLITTKLMELYQGQFKLLVQRRTSYYVKATKNRLFLHYRWA